jgi:cytosine/adenosine deaminase-related metal-dependent hydrolase
LEFSMFKRGEGEMFNWLQRSGRDMSDCGNCSPVEHLERCGALNRRLLAAHANYLGRGDAARLGQRGVSVVHCPRSHYYFRHRPFPLRRLRREGINVCLGTDSLASVYKTRYQTVELNMFEEMRVLADREPWLAPRAIVEMATINGARALGRKGRIGQLKAGALADLIVLPWAAKVSKVYEEVVGFQGKLTASMIDGRWALPPQ